jgi:hypothetical protein
MTVREPAPVGEQVTAVGGVALLWVLLYWLNGWLFISLEVNPYVNWIFLPAALRVLAVLVFGWRGALGLFIGALITFDPNTGSSAFSAVPQAALSALAPWVAVTCTARCLGVATDLKGLSFKQLALLSAAGAGLNALSHSLLFSYLAEDLALLQGFWPMFGGDLLGTLLVVYSAHFALRLLPTARSRSR